MRTKYKPWAKPFLDEHKEVLLFEEDYSSINDVELEIGSGKGQFLLNMASKFTNKQFVGIEKSAYTDDSKVTDHYAIIPTGQCNGIENLPSLEQAVYELIVRRFLSIFYPAAEYKGVKLQLGIEDECLFASAKILTNPGYMKISGIPKKSESNQDDEDDDSFSKEDFIKFVEAIKEGDEISSNGFEIKEGKTSPPKRYTSGNLILAMENAGNLIEDESLREQIKNTGIGTSATRGEILEKLVRIGYLNQNNKSQIITPEKLGEMIYEVVALTTPSLLNPEMTANWEKGLEGIINGTVDDVEYRNKLEEYIRRETNKMVENDLTRNIALNINQFTSKDSKGIATRKPLGIKCPKCGGELTTTSFGYGCSNYMNEEIKCKFSLGQVAGVDVSEEQFVKLLKEGKTDQIDGFKSKSKVSFSAKLKLEKDEAGEYSVSFDFDGIEKQKIEGVVCPDCGGNIVRTPFGYGCSNYNREDKEHSCRFNIGEIAGKKLTEEELVTLLTDGATDVLKGFKSKSKKAFSAKLKLIKNEDGHSEVTFDFDGIEPEKLEGCKCPDCGGDILIKTSGYSCSNYRGDDENSCKFFIGTIASKNLSNAVVTELLTNGKTSTIRDFKGKSGKKFDACLVLTKNEEGKTQVSFDFENVEAKVVKDVKCPICGGDIVKTTFGYGCSNYKRDDAENSCKFNIGQVAGVKLKDAQIKELLNDGITSVISGFKSKKGTKFDAKLALNKEEDGQIKGVKFVFENNDVELPDIKCPKCGEPVIKMFNGYRCKNNVLGDVDSCPFFVGKIAGVLIEQEQFEKLIKEKKTDLISGFLSKKGLYFDAHLKLDDENKVVFEFDQFK